MLLVLIFCLFVKHRCLHILFSSSLSLHSLCNLHPHSLPLSRSPHSRMYIRIYIGTHTTRLPHLKFIRQIFLLFHHAVLLPHLFLSFFFTENFNNNASVAHHKSSHFLLSIYSFLPH